MNLGWSCSGISGQFETVHDCAEHIILQGTLSRPSIDYELTIVGVELTGDATL